MSESRLLPVWADDLRRRYLRGESSMFVLHGNVYDVVLCNKQMMALTEFLTDVLLKESKDTIAVYNVATGARFTKRATSVTGLEDLLLASEKDRVFAALERLLIGSMKTAVIMEYAQSQQEAINFLREINSEISELLGVNFATFANHSTC